MPKYLTSENEDFNQEIIKFIVKLQCHMVENIKFNFKAKFNDNLGCNICEESPCTQKHLLYCKKLLGCNENVMYIPNYEDIFNNDDVSEQNYIAKLMMENWFKKKKLEDIVI